MTSWRYVVPRRMRRAASAFLARRTSERLRRELAAMAKRGAPIVAGPWLGEVGFELLYWVPFLRWCADRLMVDPERFMVVSRGGTENWYRPFASRYADVFDQVSAEMFREQHDARVRGLGEQKQTRVSEFDQDLVAAATRHAHMHEWSLLHPSLMVGPSIGSVGSHPCPVRPARRRADGRRARPAAALRRGQVLLQ
jgi:hypothetical protein